LNSSNLEVTHSSVYADTLKEKLSAVSSDLDAELNRLTIALPKPLPSQSKAQLKLAFRGPLTGNLTGYFKSTWDDKGVKRNYALTQFQV
jgi:aminopeptidase 2